mmetsp:Transcript_91480/g.218031  ORF Transcript_91480/g.218031 Transcript_91480/m.218031 type:complete len:272 (-) Transcript_91480:1074-1889(-)
MILGRHFNDVHALLALILAREDQALLLHPLLESHVELVTVSVSLVDPIRATVESGGQGLLGLCELHPSGAQSHVGTHGILGDLRHEDDHVILGRSSGVELFAGGIRDAKDFLGEVDQRDLHAQANAKVRLLPLSRQPSSTRFSGDTSIAEASGHEDAICSFEPCLSSCLSLHLLLVVRAVFAGSFQLSCIDPVNLELSCDSDCGMTKSSNNGLIGISTTFVVLAHKGDGHGLANFSLIDLLRKSIPVVEGPHALRVATQWRRLCDIQLIEL